MATNVFSSIHAENLLKIAKQEGLEVKDTESKSKIVKKINVAVEECGISQLAESLKLLELQEVCDDLDIDHGENNPKHKVVLKKRLVEKMMDDGVSKFLASLPQSKLDTFLAALGMKALKSKDDNVAQLTDVIYTMGAQTFLSKFDVPFLKQCAKDLKIKCPTESKAKIVTAIITQTAPEIEEKDTRIVFSSKKLPIKKGSTYQDIFQWYNLEELVEYCKENGLKVSGKKKEVINRILAFLDGDKENTMAKVNNAKEEPKKEAKDEKKTQKPKAVPKKSKSKEVEEVEEASEEPAPRSPKSKSKKQDSLMQDLFNLMKKEGINQSVTEFLEKALPERPGYVEGEVDAEQEDFQSWISEFTEEFEEIQSSLSHKLVDGSKTWQSKDGQMLMFLMYEGEDIWSFACKLPKHFLCFGNCAGHPFVETSKFSFLNQDGSTLEEELPCKKVTDARKVFDFMCERVNEFLFNPQ